MDKNYSCDIIKDLLPGYIDGVLSEAGENVVKGHLEECEKCNRTYFGNERRIEYWNGSKRTNLHLTDLKKLRQHTRKLENYRWNCYRVAGISFIIRFCKSLCNRRSCIYSRNEYR